MRIFTLDETYTVVCQWVKTRTAFKHTAVLCDHGRPVYETKVCYINRTWESFEYESILLKVVENFFKGAEYTKFHDIVKTLR